MKTVLLAIGKTDNPHFAAGIEDYAGRIRHYVPFDVETLADPRNTKNLSEQQQKEKEADLLLKVIQQNDYVVLFDEHGKEYTSVEFSAWMEKRMGMGFKRLVFVVGGPYGFSPRIYDRADEKVSLSRMTFSHQMVRLIITEQIYRAMTIINHEPYHHE